MEHTNENNLNNRNTPSNEYAHTIRIKEDSKLQKILNTNECKVNSRHNYHIGNVNEFIITSYSEDGLPESIELPNKKFVIGVQWHPEKLIKTDENSKKIFAHFIESCKNTY